MAHQQNQQAQQAHQDNTPPSAEDIDTVYQQLVKGVGRELVTDANAEALARRADQDGHTILATELREWQAPC